MGGEILLWRISRHTEKFDADDMTGAGAKAVGGRWNAKGTPVVYASTTISLATLETLAHLGEEIAIRNSFLIKLTIPEAVWDKRITVAPAALPITWLAEPPGSTAIQLGNTWLLANTAALMQVPSVIVPEEYNVLINPAPPDTAQITATVVRQYLYDPRLK